MPEKVLHCGLSFLGQAMSISFTLEQLLGVFEQYNLAIWPLQVVAYILGITALFSILRVGRYSNTIVSGALFMLWLWNGAVFFPFYFGPLHSISYVYGGLFLIQGIFFLNNIRNPLISFSFNKKDSLSILGSLFIAYAMLGYPLLGFLLDHKYPQSLPFGLVPCPLTVFTFGLLLMTNKKFPRRFLIIPCLWSLGGFIPVSVGVLEDIGLVVAGVLGTAFILHRNKKLSTGPLP